MKSAVGVHCERREEAGRDDVALEKWIATEERRENGGQGHEYQHQGADPGAWIGQEAPAVVHRTLGSAQMVSASARRLPSTTRTALTAVAAMTTG